MNPEAFIRKIETAQPEEFQSILIKSTAEEEKFLRAYLGEENYRKLHHLALQSQARRSRDDEKKGNVVVLHGIMGSELTAMESSAAGGGRLETGPVWLKPWRLIGGRIRLLQLDKGAEKNANPDYRVEATGMLKKWYGQQLLSLMNEGWNVKAFWYDWRKDLNKAADDLHIKLIDWFGRDEPVHIVAHSMGGLVSRTFIANYPDHWKSMWDTEGNGKTGGRLIMIGTPNRGSYEIPQILTGVQKTLRMLALLDVKNDIDDITDIVNSFYGVYQMMPYHGKNKPGNGAMNLFDAATFKRRVNIPQVFLDKAQAHHEKLESAIDKDRMIYIAGFNQLTFSGLKNNDDFLSRFGRKARKGYEVTLEGDGSVTHELGLLDGIKTFYVEEKHSKLPQHDRVMGSMNELLQTGKTNQLLKGTGKRTPSEVRSRMGEGMRGKSTDNMLAEAEAEFERELKLIESYVSLGKRSVRSSDDEAMPTLPSEEETYVADLIFNGFLGSSTVSQDERQSVQKVPALKLRVVHSDIRSLEFLSSDTLPVDAISVGHYQGVKPVYAELAVDQIVTAGILEKGAAKESHNYNQYNEEQLIVTRLTRRGALRGDLGQVYLLPDHRKVSGKGQNVDRVVAIAGMGLPGSFGVPELTVLIRELVWTLSLTNKKHLATVLISSGSGNLSYEEAIEGWLQGASQALTGFSSDESCLEEITFIEYDPVRAIKIDEAISAYADTQLLKITHDALSEEDRKKLLEADRKNKISRFQWELAALQDSNQDEKDMVEEDDDDLEPTRFTVSIEGDRFTYGALTRDASVPERTVIRDPDLIWEANSMVMSARDQEAQKEAGQLLERMLIPGEFRSHLASNVPLVFMLDNKSAQIHWEMVAQSHTDDANCFLALGRSLTRQIRSDYAPPPEPPAANRRVLRVLIVADPAEDAPLKGARDEGFKISELFQVFNREMEKKAPGIARHVDVTYLIGPQEATRLNVIKELTLRNYDVLHFAGHCFYDEKEPGKSGWIFSDGKTLSARELSSIDRVPRFVFSNACESGRVADTEVKHSVELAPSFAEAFFHSGVANFICTAWPVDDLAASLFALKLYGTLLGIEMPGDEIRIEEAFVPDQFSPMPIYKAMRAARQAVSEIPNGRKTWGAYQHYGNPYYRFFG